MVTLRVMGPHMSTLMHGSTLRLTADQQHFLTLSLAREDGLNRFDLRFLGEWEAAMRCCAQQSSAPGLIITSATSPFLAGGDIKEFLQRFALPEQAFLGEIERFQHALNALEDLPMPTLCLLQGSALGGGLEIALACNFRLATPGVRVGLPEIGLGIIPGTGGTYRLPKCVPFDWARWLISSGQLLDEKSAQGIGLINGIVDPHTPMSPPVLFQFAKRLRTLGVIPPPPAEPMRPLSQAQLMALELLETPSPHPRAEQLERERLLLHQLASTPQARTLIERFCARPRSNKGAVQSAAG